MSVPNTVQPNPVYLQSLTAGLPNAINFDTYDVYNNPVSVPSSDFVVLAHYVNFPATPVTVQFVPEAPGSNTVNILLFMNKTGPFSIRINLNTEPNDPILSVSAYVNPGLFTPSVTYATLQTTQPTVSSTAFTINIQPTYVAAVSAPRPVVHRGVRGHGP